MSKFSYIGSELDIFCHATNWKAYYKKFIQKYFGEEILEVGAGIGATTKTLASAKYKRWMCLEPDAGLADEICALIRDGQLPNTCEVRVGTLSNLSPEEVFDSILYIDVLEHIEDDRTQARLAYQHLKPGGHLIILSPAHQILFTPFDAMIGHFRRYSKKSLSQVISDGFTCRNLFYVDSVGALASLGNKLILKSGMPTKGQILLWDKLMIPVSRVCDPLFLYRVGKSVIGVWQKN